MQPQFIYYKFKFINLDLRQKLKKVLIKLLVKKYSNKIKPINPTQPNPRPNTLNSIGLMENYGFHWIEIFTSQIC